MVTFFLFIMFMIIVMFLFKKEFWNIQFMLMVLIIMFLKNLSFNSEYMYMGYNMGIDLLAYSLILLMFFIIMLMVLASGKVYFLMNYLSLFMLNLIILCVFLMVTFSSLNLMVFYLFFELSMLPVLLMIMGWGYQPERIQAGVYMLFYTLFASFPMMISMFFVYNVFKTLSFIHFVNMVDNLFMYMCMSLVFLVKFPIYYVHLWLPKAHVEAPIAGSMILAGIMLKLGGYGVARLMKMFMVSTLFFNKIIIIISLFGGLLISILCITQLDMKALIAYSSVSHMSLVLAGFMSMNVMGMMGGLVLMIAHGLCSSGLFCMANIYYERSFSRSFFMNKGMLSLTPSLAIFSFLLSVNNMAAPPSLNLLGEILLINGLVGWSYWVMIVLFILSFFGAVYSLLLYINIQHGSNYSGLFSISEGKISEYLLLFMHWLPLNLFILKSELVLSWI
uniref:NADH-ubiquinone oxidoreductase chain 4 n=1 Tax=Passalidae sp. GENSP01 TaxID=1205571 RepID=A0A0S2MRR1_9SCAR|nr:NADH deshydrogenase subunit 4 [Passalidae sp. GENSP01]